jgi:hypothetical protein
MAQSEIELDLGEETLTCTAAEVATAFSALLREMRAAIPFIQPDERAALRRIMSYDSGTLTVAEVFPDFTRESAAHVALRRLRTAQFILPAGRDMWDRDQRIAIKPFARLVWDRLGEAAIFGEGPATVDEDDIDLALPTVDAPDEAETVRVKSKAAAWEDDDVLDYLQDTPG